LDGIHSKDLVLLSFKIALRFLTHGRTQTLLIIIGIAVAISVQVFVGLLIEGLQRTIVDRTVGNSPQITLVSSSDINTIRDWRRVVSTIEQLDVAKAISVSATANAFAQKGNKEVPILLRGFVFDKVDQIYRINRAIYEGRPYQSSREVIIGKDLKTELELNLGDKLSVVAPNGSSYTFNITGFYDLGVSSINKGWVFANLQTSQQVFDFEGRISSIEVTVNDLFQADVIANYIGEGLHKADINGIKIENWKEQNRELLSGLEGQRNSSLIIQVVVLISVIVAISSVLVISVLQKSRQIGILKAMGIRDRAASMIFLYQGFLLGIVGSTLGILLGLGLLYSFYTFNVTSEGKPLVELYLGVDFIVLSWFIALLAATVAGVIPARKSLKLNPIDTIREG
jgi:lipoprotein-releasing system permease protein